MKDFRYLVVKNEYNAGSKVVILDIAPKDGGRVFDFLPGQYAMLAYRNSKGVITSKHAFSIASSSQNKQYLQFGIKVLGPFTQGIARMAPGDEIFVSGPFGSFIFDESKKKSPVMFAGGIGITPFMSIIRSIDDRKLDIPVILFYSNKTLAGTVFFDELNDLARKNKNIKTVFAVTDDPVACSLPGIENGRIGSNMISSHVPAVSEREYFLCGPKPFMDASESCLKSLGVRAGSIKREAFSITSVLPARTRLRFAAFASAAAAAFFGFFTYTIYSNASKGDVNNAVYKSYPLDKVTSVNDAAFKRLYMIYDLRDQSVASFASAKVPEQKTKSVSPQSVTYKTVTAPIVTKDRDDREEKLAKSVQEIMGELITLRSQVYSSVSSTPTAVITTSPRPSQSPVVLPSRAPVINQTRTSIVTNSPAPVSSPVFVPVAPAPSPAPVVSAPRPSPVVSAPAPTPAVSAPAPAPAPVQPAPQPRTTVS